MSKRGFTLIEVMVATAILGLMITLTWAGSSQTFRAKKRAETRSDKYHEGSLVVRKMADEISMAFLTKTRAAVASAAQEAATPTPPAATSTVATEEPLKTFFIGEDKGDGDSLKLTSFAHLRFFKDAKESDQCRISYETETDTEGLKILRREEAWLDKTTDIKSAAIPFAQGVQKFNIEYYDSRKGEWGKYWDSTKAEWLGRLPDAVRITVSFPDPDNEKESIEISTSVVPPLARGPIEM